MYSFSHIPNHLTGLLNSNLLPLLLYWLKDIRLCDRETPHDAPEKGYALKEGCALEGCALEERCALLLVCFLHYALLLKFYSSSLCPTPEILFLLILPYSSSSGPWHVMTKLDEDLASET